MAQVQDPVLRDYLNKSKRIVEVLSDLTVDLAVKGCMDYKEASKVHELLMDILLVLAKESWSSVSFVCNRTAIVLERIASAWEECKNQKS